MKTIKTKVWLPEAVYQTLIATATFMRVSKEEAIVKSIMYTATQIDKQLQKHEEAKKNEEVPGHE